MEEYVHFDKEALDKLAEMGYKFFFRFHAGFLKKGSGNYLENVWEIVLFKEMPKNEFKRDIQPLEEARFLLKDWEIIFKERFLKPNFLMNENIPF